MRQVLAILLSTTVAAAFPGAAGAQMYATAGTQQYLVTDIGVLSSKYPYCSVYAINSSGQVAGNSNVSPSDSAHGYFYPGNGAPLVDIGPTGPGGAYTQILAYGLNDSSWIAGSVNGEAAVWTPQSGLQGVGYLTGGTYSVLEAINNSDVAVGGATPAGATLAHAAIWDPTDGLRDLNSMIVNPPVGWTPRVATSISQNGLIAGIGDGATAPGGTFPPPNQAAFVLNCGTLTQIPDPGEAIYPEAINSSGEVAGFYFNTSGSQRAFVYSPALGTVDIGTLGLSATGGYTSYIEAFGVNDLGVVAGSEGLADGSGRAFLWTESGGMVEIEPPAGVLFGGAEGINNSGQVIIQGLYANDAALGYRGFVLTPVPEPSTLGLSISFSFVLILFIAHYCFRRRAPNHNAGTPDADRSLPSPEKVQDSDTSGRERHANRASAKRPRRSWAKRHRASLLARAKAAAAEKAQRTLACLWKSPRDRVRRWWRSFLAHEERRRKAVQRQPQHYYYRTCRIEGLETRLALTPTTVTLALPGYVLNGVNVLTSDQRITSALIDDKTNQPTAWTNGDTLVIPPSFANTTIAIQDSGGNLTPIAAAEIDVQAPGVALEGLASTDVLAIDPANPTTLVADGAADFATISAPISPLSAGTTIIRTTGNSGTFVLDAAAAVSTITASAGAVEVGADAGINAATISVSGGTFTIDATSATSRQLTATTVNITGGTFKIDATTATPPPMQLVATTVNVYSGAFDVEGNLSIAKTGTVAGSLTVSGSAVLQGAATGLVTLAAGCGLVYTSSQDCDFLPQISGAGYLDVNCPAGAHAWGATFTLDNGKNSYTGGTQVYAGELKMGRIGGFNNPSYGPLALYGTSVFDVNDNSCYVLSLYGDPDVTITNSAAPESSIPAVIIGSGGSGSSTFAGTTLDGSLGGEVGLDVEDTTLTLTPTANIASFDGIILGGARLVFNETGNAVNVACSIRAANLKSFIDFNVAENAPTTFTGSISSDTLGLDLEKDGPGTLTLAPAACAYWNMSVLSGTLVYGNANAVPGGSNIDVNDGATLDGGGVPFLPPFYEVTMYGGTITDGVFGATGNIVVYSGIIDASAALSGAALLDKERSSTAPGSGTLALNGTVEAVSATVNAGTLQVDGTLTSNVTVNNAAVLSTAPGSLITGSIAYNSSATSTIHGQIDDSTGGATVTGGTFVVTSPAGLADGSALTVGDPGAFAAPLAPQVMSLRYNGPSIATTGLVTYTLYLNESVTGVDPSDFSIDSTGASGTIASVSGSGNRYLITVSVSGSGTLALKMTNPGDIADANGKTIPASTLPIASSTALVNPTLYWSGSGDWTSGAWKLSDGTTTPWIDGSRVVLAAGSELTLNGTVHVASITAMGTASIDGGTICLVTPPSPPAPLPEGEGSIKVVSGVLRVNSTIAGAADWSKLGGGILVLEGPMIYTGTATVAAGTLLSAAALPSLAVLAGGDALTATDIVSGDAAGTSFAPTISALVPMLLARDGGTISRADMIQILQSAIVDGSLSDEALAALDALTTPSVSATLGEAQYVSVLASDVVNVNPANEHFEGQILGDLDSQPSPQARATALTDLIGKWFEGIDLPAVTYPQYYTYTVTAGSLYGTAGVPSSADMAQGAIGDCYFISTLGSIASSNPAAIRDMIIDNGDGSYTIRFYYNAGGLCTADYVTVNSSLPGNCGSTVNTAYAHPGPQGGFWLCLIEKAYAQWNETGREGRDGTNSYAALSGGFMGAVDQQVLGSDAQTYCPATGPAAEQAIISAIRAGKAVQAAIFTDGSALFSQLQLVSCHAYDVASCDPVTATFTLLNPWGGYEPQPLTWANFVEYCPWFNVADASNTTPAAAAAASAAGPASAGTASAAPALSAAAVVGYFARAAAPDAFAPLTPNLGAIDAVMATCAAT